MDITDLQFLAETFDTIICSHVLEYIPNESQALSEIYRVLKRGGWAILITGIWAEPTIESAVINDPLQRVKIFGRDDIFVRQYGVDYPDRIQVAGFEVTVISVDALVGRTEAIRMGLIEKNREMCFCFCKKG